MTDVSQRNFEAVTAICNPKQSWPPENPKTLEDFPVGEERNERTMSVTYEEQQRLVKAERAAELYHKANALPAEHYQLAAYIRERADRAADEVYSELGIKAPT